MHRAKIDQDSLLITLTALYCHTINTVTSSFEHFSTQRYPDSTQELYFAELSNGLFYTGSSCENAATNINNLPAPGQRNMAASFDAIIQLAGQRMESSYHQYNRFF